MRAFLDRTVEEARTTGYVSTLLGRRRYLPELTSKDPRVRIQAENVAVNTPMQGTAADLIKLAMIRIDRRIRDEALASRMMLQIHDELLLEVPPDEHEYVGDDGREGDGGRHGPRRADRRRLGLG